MNAGLFGPIGFISIVVQHFLFSYFISACIAGAPNLTGPIVAAVNSVVHQRVGNVKLACTQDRAAQNEAIISPSFPISIKLLCRNQSVKKSLPNA